MKKFNKERTLKKLCNKNNIKVKKMSIIVSITILIGAIIYFSFARFETSIAFNLMSGNVSVSGDVFIRRILIDGVPVDSVPAQGTGYDFDKAVCNNNSTAIWNNENWKLKLYLNESTACSIFFKETYKLRGTASNVLAQFGEDDTTTDVIEKGWNNAFAYDGTVDNNLRYVGSDPKNYIQFNGELWRIIGVMNNIENSSGQSQTLFKIIRADSLGRYGWDSSVELMNGGNYGNGANGINQWGESIFEDGTYYEGSDLMRELNTDYLGNITVGTDGKWYANNSKTVDMPTTTISDDAQAMIETVVWHLGSPNNDNGTYDSNYTNILTSSVSYARERANTNGKICAVGSWHCTDTVVRTSTWTGKVGLPYMSDFGFQTAGGEIVDRNTCLNASLSKWYNFDHSEECRNSLWVKYNYNYAFWTLSPVAGDYNADYAFCFSGNEYYTNLYYMEEVYPVVFLKSNISVTGGDGSLDNPYTIG